MLKSGRKIWLSIVSLMVALLFSVEMRSQSGNNFVLNTHSLTKISVENSIEDIVFDTISDYFQVQVSDNYTVLHTDEGRPSLPVISKIIALPIGCNIDIKIVKSTTQEYNLERMGIKRKMYPIQPSLSKSNNGNSGNNPILYKIAFCTNGTVSKVEYTINLGANDTGAAQSINISSYGSYNGIQLLFKLGTTALTANDVIIDGSIEVTLSKEPKY